MSLRRLKLERIDLWQLHRIDPKVPVEESLGADQEAPAAGQDPARRSQRSEAARDRPGPQGHRHRQRAEPVQPRRPPARRRRRVLRQAQARLHSLVPRCRRQTRPTRRQTRCRGQSTRSDGLAAFAGLAAASLARHAADPRHIFGQASRREHRRCRGHTSRHAEWKEIEDAAK